MVESPPRHSASPKRRRSWSRTAANAAGALHCPAERDFVSELPTRENGKLYKHALRERLATGQKPAEPHWSQGANRAPVRTNASFPKTKPRPTVWEGNKGR